MPLTLPRLLLFVFVVGSAAPSFADHLLAAPQSAGAAQDSDGAPAGTPVDGKVVGRSGEDLLIDITGGQAKPEAGNLVTLTAEIAGRTLDAGRAKVIAVAEGVVTARITSGKPNVGMAAVIWVMGPRDHFQAAEAIFKGEWPEDPAAVRELRATAIILYLKAAVGRSPHEGARDRLREIRKKWGFFDVAPEVQHALGRYYHLHLRNSDEKPERPKDAAEWYRLAAAQRYAPAIGDLGKLYNLGWGVERDKERAHELWEQASELGDSAAMYSLASHYANYVQVQGHGSQGDGIRWLTRAAEAGSCLASADLGELYMEGSSYRFELVGELDRERGLEALRRGARAGCTTIRRRLKEMGETW